MTGVALAIVGSAVIGAGVSIYSADKQADAAETAAEAQVEAAELGIAAQTETANASLTLQQELAEQGRQDLAPWRQQGEVAQAQLMQGLKDGSFKMDQFKFDFKSDPSYQFRLEEGIKARDRSASSRGRLQSGAQDKAITNYAQNLASEEYGKSFNRAAAEYSMEQDKKVRDYNILSQISSSGQAAAAGQAGVTGQLASTSANVLSNLGVSQNQAQQNIGSAYAQSAYNQGQAYAQGAQGVGTSVNQGIQNWMTYDYLNK